MTYIGLRLDPARLDGPLSSEQLSNVRPSPADPRSVHALKIAREGWTVRDVLAHGVIDCHPVIVGPAAEAADRGLFQREYDGVTLRDHLGAPAQYEVDPRITP